MEGINRLKILSKDIKDKSLLKIINYLLSRTDMNDKYLNDEKNLSQMVTFIKSQAKKLADKEQNKGMIMIEDEIVYGWAIHYWDESNKDLDIDKVITNISVQSKAKTVNSEKNKTSKDSNNKYVSEGQLTLFDVY